MSVGFCLVSSLLVCLFAAPLMGLFVEPGETEIIAVGVEYLRIEGMCYCGIGILFLLYGLFRGLGRPGVSVVLTVVSLGTRVALAYLLAPIPAVGLKGIWWAVPIGWVLADLAGLVLYRRKPLPAETACAPEGKKNRRGRNASPRRFLLFRSISRPSGSPGTRRRSSCGR